MNGKSRLESNAPGLTRRRLAIGASLACGLSAFADRAVANRDTEISHTAESIHQEPVFKASRQRVYEALMEPRQFGKVVQLSAAMQSAMSLGNKPTAISQQVGGAFSLFGGHIVGRQIELVTNERIVQAWRVVDWTPGAYSIAKFEFMDERSATKVVFDHVGFPVGKAQHLAEGWKANYWEPLEKYLCA